MKTPPISKYEIAESLNISVSTLRRWLRREKIQVPRGIISRDKVYEIYIRLGYEGLAFEFKKKFNFTPPF